MNKKILTIEIVTLIVITFLAVCCCIDMNQCIEFIKIYPVYLKIFIFIAITALQIVFAFLPGEPLELAAGYLFGPWLGTLVCLIGSFIGTLCVYCLVKIFKHHIIDVMFKSDKVEEVCQLFSSQKGLFWIFILFLIPGTPKDVITYVASLGNIDLKKWLILTTIGRIPSVVTSTFLSGSLKSGEIFTAIMIFLITVILTVTGMIVYKKMTNKKRSKTIYNNKGVR